jgi:hypothetical protein
MQPWIDFHAGDIFMLKLAAIAAAILCVSPALAQQPMGTNVAVQGCVRSGVEGGCLVITDKASGKTYQINAAVPKPDPARRLVVRLKGTVSGMVDFCQQGPVLENVSWSYTRMRCADAGRAGAAQK